MFLEGCWQKIAKFLNELQIIFNIKKIIFLINYYYFFHDPHNKKKHYQARIENVEAINICLSFQPAEIKQLNCSHLGDLLLMKIVDINYVYGFL